MKDKLVKNHHRGIYYRARAFFLFFVVLASGVTVAIIPTYIALKGTNNKEATRAVNEPQVQDEENPVHDSEKEIGNFTHFYAEKISLFRCIPYIKKGQSLAFFLY